METWIERIERKLAKLDEKLARVEGKIETFELVTAVERYLA